MTFAQLVLGPPGSGKTTYTRAARQFLTDRLRRSVALVNLDPSSEDQETAFDVDVRQLVRAEEVMERLRLGPNGALVFCIELLVEQNLEWLLAQLATVKHRYLIFDCPGQVELYTHHSAMGKLVAHLQNKLHYRLCTVHLVDSYMCSDPGSFVSALLVSLSAMMRLETPHVNVLSKIDIAEAYGRLALGLEYYTDVLDLSYLMDKIADDPFAARYKALNRALAEVVEDFSLVQFFPLSAVDEDLLRALTRVVDKATGYLYTSEGDGQVPMESAGFSAEPAHASAAASAYEKYLGRWDDEAEEAEEAEQEAGQDFTQLMQHR